MNQSVWEADNRKTIEHFTCLIENYKCDFRSADWGSKSSQENRFKILTEIHDLSNKSILDVGCGIADLYQYLSRYNTNVAYTGYDITPAAIQHAAQRFPGISLGVRDLSEESNLTPEFDYVIASGIFYLRQVNAMTYLEKIAANMFSLCRHGVAFNCLSIYAQHKKEGEFYADPSAVLKVCLKITPWATIRHDYFPHDFTVYLYRESQA